MTAEAMDATDNATTRTNIEQLKQDYYLLIEQDDIVFEEETLRNPFSIKCWLRYLEHKSDSSIESRIFIYERAVKELPGSYKLWKQYLDLRTSVLLEGKPDAETGLRTRRRSLRDREWERVNNAFERSLVLCNKFPVIWIDYCRFLMHQNTPTRTRRTFDRALRSLPITQHAKLWDLYLKFARLVGGETAVRVWRRFLKLEPGEAEEYVAVLLELKPPRYAEAARVLASIVEDTKFASRKGKTSYQIWMELLELVKKHPKEIIKATQDNILVGTVGTGDDRVGAVDRLDVDRMIRSGIGRFTDQVGLLWNGLANWYVAKDEWEKARDIYEEAIASVKTVQDFTIVFDAYAKMEETILSTTMEVLQQMVGNGEDIEGGLDEIDIDLNLARFEKLMERRPFLVNDVLLRQNPQNVHEWEKRVALWVDRNNKKKAVETYSEALQTIQPQKAHGKLHMLWVHFAEFYEKGGDLPHARQILEKATRVPFKKADDLAEVWCQWAEMELRHDNFEQAIEVMGRATAPPRGSEKFHQSIRYNDESKEPQKRLFKSLKLWSFYVDLEESLGTVESTKALYDRILELKIATPQIIINYATFLEEQKWFEESYKAYEKGIEVFGYPIAFDIWNLYLTKFIARYGGTKIERTRDLFEHALDKCPPNLAKPLYLMYAKLEEDHGLARHAMRIYDRATRAVSDQDRLEVFNIYISKATSYFGLTSTREIYEKAIEVLPDRKARDMCVRFSDMETRLGEIDRARAIWGYASQFSDPRMDVEFWKLWHEFEVKHGNEDTFKEMLRIKRSVQAKFNTDVTFITAQILANQANEAIAASAASAAPSTMAELEAEETERLEAEAVAAAKAQKEGANTRVVGFVRAKKTEPELRGNAEEEAGGASANPDAIEIDEDDDEDEDEDGMEEDGDGKEVEVEGVQKIAVPDAVFGGLANLAKGGEEEKLGAKERFKRKR
ncbi:pre-mRNA-splicing factor syf1 [Rhizophlyctis rosea]|uniref:Pre-mRNA-splicing factor SYF1 n=1 Tax=Rhizophlyctis rosea TaxID=64517 RepID=A0AAD5SNW3_9FUNG|nr:pre-mRNA-splicing factor syf1 [Rhizophlyctis rosea]